MKITLRSASKQFFLIAASAIAGASWAQATDTDREGALQFAAKVASELSKLCPPAEAGSQQAFDTCRAGLYKNSSLRAALPEFILWGRQRDASAKLKDTKLTQLAPDVVTGLYLPLFMFSGKHSVEYVEREKMYRVHLQVGFRNRLAPGQFPYPFWHEAEKWSMYQKANEVLLWWDPKMSKVKVGQFTALAPAAPAVAISDAGIPRPFDGQWMWTDDKGRTQPMVTVFDGLLAPQNPYIVQLDAAYKRLALRMRDSKCNDCHVPDNPDGMKRLVLLQTPAHAAGEIKRLLTAVKSDKMPVDDLGIEKPLDAKTKAALLEEGAAFDSLYDAAKKWEASAKAR